VVHSTTHVVVHSTTSQPMAVGTLHVAEFFSSVGTSNNNNNNKSQNQKRQNDSQSRKLMENVDL